jgi:superfamily I DNA/RNA helicase
VNGKDLSTRLKDAAKDDTMRTPLAKLACKLYHQGVLENICNQLEYRSVSLCEVIDIPVVSTVHQVKGFEYDHCAVHEDLLNPENDAEKSISFVAFTRHKKSLTVLWTNST